MKTKLSSRYLNKQGATHHRLNVANMQTFPLRREALRPLFKNACLGNRFSLIYFSILSEATIAIVQEAKLFLALVLDFGIIHVKVVV